MTGRAAGRPAAAALAALALAAPTVGATLEVVDGTGRVAMAAPLPRDGRWCLVWNHSVTGIEVSDCFRTEEGRMVLERSHQPDFAAGLGHIPGRGVQRSDGTGGYWIEGIEAAMPPEGLPVRRGGPAVNHRIVAGGTERALPPGHRGEKLILRIREE